MLSFQIPTMSCAHCVRAITEAVHIADANARVRADLAQGRVEVETTATRDAVAAQLAEAGYPPA